MHQDPRLHAGDRSRWTLRSIRQAYAPLRRRSLAAVHRLLRRSGVVWKRARGHVHSPDANYFPKLRRIERVLHLAERFPEQVVVLFEDEFSFFRQPALSQDWQRRGSGQKKAELGLRVNRLARVAGAINALTGQVHFLMSSRIGVKQLVDFYAELRRAYPKARTLYLIQDNWPVHLHADVLAALKPQRLAFPIPKSTAARPVARKRARRLNLPIRLRQLPTYAPWTNPIEKLWRKLRQELLHLHSFGDDWNGLRTAVSNYLGDLKDGSLELLRYVGLSDPANLYAAALHPQTT